MEDIVKSWVIPVDPYTEKHDDKWDFCPKQLPNESFLSWFTRLAKDNCSDVRLLYQTIISRSRCSIKNINPHKLEQAFMKIEIDNKIQRDFLLILNQYCNISLIKPTVHRLKLKIKPESHLDKLLIIMPTPRYCPLCLQEDKIPFIRDYWYYPFVTYCEKHQILLSETCPFCYRPFRFWASDWDLPITRCYSCKKDICEESSLVTNVSSDYQTKIKEILRIHTLNGKTASPEIVFQKIWKIILRKSKDPLIQHEDKMLPVDRMFRALDFVLMHEEFNLIKLDEKEFQSQFDYELDMLLKEYPDLQKNEKFLARCEELKPFFRNQIVSKSEIFNSKLNSSLAPNTIYKWILSYKKSGIHALIPKKKNNRKRSIWFPDQVHQILEENVANFNGKECTMTECSLKIVEECKALGYTSSQIPSRTTIYKRIRKKINENGILSM